VRAELGDVLTKQGHWAFALNQYREAHRLDPTSVNHMDRIGGASLNFGAIEDAIAWYERAFAAEPHSARLACCVGLAHLHARRYADAEHNLRRALALDPTYHDARVQLGSALVR